MENIRKCYWVYSWHLWVLIQEWHKMPGVQKRSPGVARGECHSRVGTARYLWPPLAGVLDLGGVLILIVDIFEGKEVGWKHQSGNLAPCQWSLFDFELLIFLLGCSSLFCCAQKWGRWAATFRFNTYLLRNYHMGALGLLHLTFIKKKTKTKTQGVGNSAPF